MIQINNLLTASQARELAEQHAKIEFQSVIENIKAACKQGKTSVYVGKLLGGTKTLLENAGYTVEGISPYALVGASIIPYTSTTYIIKW